MVGFTMFVVFTFAIHAVVGHWERTERTEFQELKRKVEEISKQYEYPEEFVDDFFSTLKPEEQKLFNVDSLDGLDERSGEAGPCSFNNKLVKPQYASDVNNVVYYVLNTEKVNQTFEAKFCNPPSGAECKFEVRRPKKNELVPSCCKQELKLIDMYVIPVPVEKITKVRRNNTTILMVDNKEYILNGLHSKKLFIESECKCQDPIYKTRNLQCS